MLKPPTEKISAETREKLLALAEFMETDQAHRLDMSRYMTDCGTSCCIAGYVAVSERHSVDKTPYQFYQDAMGFLGVTDQQACDLFLAYDVKHSTDRAKAVRVLRNFAYTGDVDWSV